MKCSMPSPVSSGKVTIPKLCRWACLIALISMAQPAFSDSEWEASTSPWYFGLGIGESLLGLNKSNIASAFSAATTASSYNHDDFAFKLYGGYFLDPLLAVEFGFAELGNVIATTNGTSSSLFNIYSIYVDTLLNHRYNRNAAIYAKVGAHFWDIGTKGGSSITNGTDLMLGAGIELNIYGGNNRVVHIEWVRYQFDRVYLDSSDTLTLNLVFKY